VILISSRRHFGFVNVFHKYLNMATFSEGLLAILCYDFILNSVPQTGGKNLNILKSRTMIEAWNSSRFSHFTSRPGRKSSDAIYLHLLCNVEFEVG
jgi:hypothetical protein